MPSRRWLLLILAVAVLQTACGPIRSTTGLVDARAAIRSAEDVNADRVALYEMTLAREYLQKAREEMGYNDYYVAEQLTTKAIELATAAREKAVGQEHLLEDDGTGPAVEEPDLDVLPDVGELAPDRRAGDEEAGDDLLQPESANPWGAGTAPAPAPAPPASDPWEMDTPPATPPPPAELVEPRPRTDGNEEPKDAEPPPAEAPADEEEDDSGDLLLPDWLEEEDP